MYSVTIDAHKKYMAKHKHIFQHIAKVYSFQNMEGVYDDIKAVPHITSNDHDIFITNPFFDESHFEEVDPFEYYGDPAVIYWMGVCASRFGFDLHLDRFVAKHEMSQKRFLCVWGEGYRDIDISTPEYEEVDLSFFDGDHGYDEDTVERINKLRIGEACVVHDVTSIHTVVRIR